MRLLLALSLLTLTLGNCVCSDPEQPVVCAETADCADGSICTDGACVTAQKECSLDDACDDGFTCSLARDGQDGECRFISGNNGTSEACDDDEVCASGACSGGVCVNQCTLDDACAGDLRCVLDGPRRVCVPPTGDGATGDACGDPRDCVSGTCVRLPDEDEATCAPACDAAHPCEGNGEVCLALDGGARACLPGTADGEACTASSQCAGGFCVNDRDGPVCASACAEGDVCADDFLCVSDSEGTRICMPQRQELADGEECGDDRDCASRDCERFNDGTTDFGRLCTSPCPEDGCGVDRICWTTGEPGDVGVCGPEP